MKTLFAVLRGWKLRTTSQPQELHIFFISLFGRIFTSYKKMHFCQCEEANDLTRDFYFVRLTAVHRQAGDKVYDAIGFQLVETA